MPERSNINLLLKILTETPCSHEHHFFEMKSSHFSLGEVEETKLQHLTKQALRQQMSGLKHPFIKKGHLTTDSSRTNSQL